MDDVFYSSKQYVTVHCQQSFISVFNAIFIHREFYCLVWLMLCHGGLLSKRIFWGSTLYMCSAISALLHTIVDESVRVLHPVKLPEMEPGYTPHPLVLS
jgi:hypothetical protein